MDLVAPPPCACALPPPRPPRFEQLLRAAQPQVSMCTYLRTVSSGWRTGVKGVLAHRTQDTHSYEMIPRTHYMHRSNTHEARSQPGCTRPPPPCRLLLLLRLDPAPLRWLEAPAVVRDGWVRMGEDG
eukprot:898589-Rhodomonas_salina.2